MSTTIPEDQQKNYETFRDCLSTALISKINQPEPKARRRSKPKKTAAAATSSQSSTSQKIEDGEDDTAGSTSTSTTTGLDDAETLADFADYLASAIFASLPAELQTLDHVRWRQDAALPARYAPPLTGLDVSCLLPNPDPAIGDTLAAYGLTCPATTQGPEELLAPVLTAYVRALAAPPPPPASTRAAACELCARHWVPLTYHHLIPRAAHARAVRRGWHRREDLGRVAWLCGACHRFVHRFAGHEALAREFDTVEKLLREEQVVRWVEWVGRLRWKGR
ncbi:YisB protein [Xylariomycetidae sp. FL0641]|nr:YisB protein [Xylariomycetidae sp. FL0641]